jgi:penicillin-binding protein 1A
MKTGIQRSLNLIAAHAMVELTDPADVAGFAHRMGITSELDPYPSLALGTEEVSPLEMATGYATFASEGTRSVPRAVTSVENLQGDMLFSNPIDTTRVLDSATAFLITDALEAVVDSGTAASVRRYYAGPAAGKTGTTQRSTDAWFVGYTPDYATAVWMGFDDAQRKLTGTFRYGGTACAPVWGRMMARVAQRDTAFVQPESVEYLPLCTESGQLATEDCPLVQFYPVNLNLLPAECDEHGGGWFW